MSIEYVITFALISAVGIILGAVINIANFTSAQTRKEKEDSSSLATALATVTTSIDHLENRIVCGQQDITAMKHEMSLSIRDIKNEMTINMRAIQLDMQENRDRLVRSEESTKAAHKRIDELTVRTNRGGAGD